MGMDWDEFEQAIEDELGRIEDEDIEHFVAAAWPGRVEVRADGEGLELYVGHVKLNEEVPGDVRDRLAGLDGWGQRDTTFRVPGPFSRAAVAELIVDGLREGWQADPGTWAYVGADPGYGKAVKDAPE